MRTIINNYIESGCRIRQAPHVFRRTTIPAHKRKSFIPHMREIRNVEPENMGLWKVLKPHLHRRGNHMTINRPPDFGPPDSQSELKEIYFPLPICVEKSDHTCKCTCAAATHAWCPCLSRIYLPTLSD